MHSTENYFCILLATIFFGGVANADEQSYVERRTRILSWNISNDGFATQPKEVQALLFRWDPGLLLLDEVSPSVTDQQIRQPLVDMPLGVESEWQVDIGKSGGRQRGVIIGRWPLATLPEFASVVPYPDEERANILQKMPDTARNNEAYSMAEGIPVNGAIIHTFKGRLLAIVTDLQCCGDDPDSWQEYRRRVESKVIRGLVNKILARTNVDGIVLAGDFNAVNGSVPLILLSGPYKKPHAGLIPAEIYHEDDSTTWTWDGSETSFPSNVLDYQLYTPQTLTLTWARIIGSEDISAEELERRGLQSFSMNRLSRHRPLIVEYVWRQEP